MKYIHIITLIITALTFQIQGSEYSSRAGLVEVSQSNFDNAVLKSEKPVVVIVSAVWCGPCQQLKPVANQLAKTLGDSYLFTKIDFDQNRGIADRYPINGLPTILFFKDGQLKGSSSGYMNQAQLQAKMKSIF